MGEVGLGRKVVWGSIWSIALNVIGRALSLISIVILSRLITPYDLGIYAAAAVVIELVNVLTDVGVYPVLIHRKKPDVTFYQTAWTIQVVRGITIFVLLQVFAEYFIHIYTDNNAVGDVIQIISIAIIFSGFNSIYLVNLQKNIDFKRLLKFKLTCRIVGFTATVISAYLLRSYWALVIGNIAGTFAGLVLGHLYAPGPHRFTFEAGHDLLGSSRWVLIHQIGSFVSQKIDTVLITRFLGLKTLGIYELGYQLAMLPSQELALPVARALFPGLAKLQDDKKKFAEMLTTALSSILYIALPAGVGLIIVSGKLVSFLFPESWKQAAEVLQILAVFGMFRVLFGPCISALMGYGYMKLTALLTLINMILRIGGLSYGVISYGLHGLLVSSVLIAAIQAVIYISVLVNKELLSFSQLIGKSWRAVFSTLTMAALLKMIIHNVDSLFSSTETALLFLLVAIGCLVYILTLFLVWKVSGSPSGLEEILYTRFRKSLPW